MSYHINDFTPAAQQALRASQALSFGWGWVAIVSKVGARAILFAVGVAGTDIPDTANQAEAVYLDDIEGIGVSA